MRGQWAHPFVYQTWSGWDMGSAVMERVKKGRCAGLLRSQRTDCRAHLQPPPDP